MLRVRPLISLAMIAAAALLHAQFPVAWHSVGVGGGGAFFAPTFSPFDENEMWLSCDMSGLYHSTNAGTSWTLTPFTRIQTGNEAPQMQYTSNPNLLYNIDTTDDNQTPVVSTNGGITWNPLANDPTGQGAWYLYADPTTASRLFVTDYANLYFSADAGKTWRTVASGNNDSGVVLAGVYFNGQTIVAATSLGMYSSSNGGSTFSVLNTPGIPLTEAIVSFAAGRSGSTTRFFAVTLSADNIWGGITGDNYNAYANVYSLDFGASTAWTNCVKGIPSDEYPFFVGMARNDIDNVYLAGGSDAGVPIVLKTTNGGQSWSDVLLTYDNQNVITGWQGQGGDRGWGYDGLCFGFQVSPTDSKRAAFTGYGFCHMTTNGGTTWQQVYVSAKDDHPAGTDTPQDQSYTGIGLENTSCWWVAWSNASTLWASFSDIKGIRSVDGGNTWSFNYTGQNLDCTYQVAIAANGTMYMATSSAHDMYESTHLTDASIDGQTGEVLISTDQGHIWTPLGSIGHIVMGIALDPTNAKRLYATVASSTVGGVYVCQDVTKGASAVWTRLAAPPRTQGHAFNIAVLKDGTLVATFSGRMAPSFTNSSGIFVSADGGATWTDRSHPNMDYWTMDVTIDPSDSTQSTWYVGVFSGWGGLANGLGGLFKTTNRGVTWKEVWNSDRVASCTVDPRNPNIVYATTETEGLWASVDATKPNPTFRVVSSYPFRQPQRVFFNPYRVGEIWVTSFGNGLRVGEQVGP